MKVTIEVDVNPFSVPKYVSIVNLPGRREDEFNQAKLIPLHALPVEVLATLCKQFKDEVYEVANKNIQATSSDKKMSSFSTLEKIKIDETLYHLIKISFDTISNREHFEYELAQFIEHYARMLSENEIREFIETVLMETTFNDEQYV